MNDPGKTVFTCLSTVLLLSLILWVLGSISRSMLLPGLPISSLMAIIPVVAAIITGSRNSSLSYVPTVIVQLGDVTKIRNKLWIIPAVFLNPLIFIGSYIGGIVFIAAIFHASINVSWQLFPVHGSYYEPAITATISIIIAIVLIMIDRWLRR
jgi:hypothetical protein